MFLRRRAMRLPYNFLAAFRSNSREGGGAPLQHMPLNQIDRVVAIW
jgi:hypothetical protein